jgi:beta-lactamase regulating signal transducer with metallopeptidase domain
MILEHELSHRAARDIYLLWFAAFLEALVPWNVFIWWQASCMRRAVEMDCDARVLTIFQHPVAYAQMLVRVASAPSERPWSRFSPALVGEATRLEQRIAAISSPQQLPPRARSIHALIMVAAVVLALALRPPMAAAWHHAGSQSPPRMHTAH